MTTTTTTMKTLSIKLTDIWTDCQKQLIDMRRENNSLKTCLKSSELIRRYLEKCNETLVAIIELCQLDADSNVKIVQLIGSVKQLENCIQREKQNSRTLMANDSNQWRDIDNNEDNDRTLVKLITDWSHNISQAKTQLVVTYDKSSQTTTTTLPIIIGQKTSDQTVRTQKVLTPTLSQNSLITTDIGDIDVNMKLEVTNHSETTTVDDMCVDLPPMTVDMSDDDGDDYDGGGNDDNSIESDDSIRDRDFDADDDVVKKLTFSDSDDNYDDNSDYEWSSKNKKRKTNKKSTTTTTKKKRKRKRKGSFGRPSEKWFRRLEKINEWVMPLKVDDHYVCDQIGCDFTASQKRKMYSHLLVHKTDDSVVNDNPFDEQRQQEQQRIRQLVAEYRVDNQYVCRETDCQYSSQRIRDFYRHYKRHQLGDGLANYTISDEHIDRILKHFIVEDNNNDDKYVCVRENCQFSCPLGERDVFYAHHKQHDSHAMTITDESVIVNPDNPDRPFGCDECSSAFKIKYDYKRHKREVHPKALYVCNVGDCRSKLKNFKSFVYHRESIHLKLNKTKPMSSLSSSLSSSPKKKKRHRLRVSNNTVEMIAKNHMNRVCSLFLIDDKYVCLREHCLFSCSLEQQDVFYDHFKQHQLTADPIMTTDGSIKHYGCYLCGKVFDKRERCLKHQINTHPKVPFVCRTDNCGVRIKSWMHFEKHRDCCHRKMQNYSCDWPGCEYRAFSGQAIKNHKLVHSEVKALSCEWPGCQFRCKVKYVMVTHMRTHTREKPYACDWPGCTFSCTQQCALTVHKRRHTGEKPYECRDNGCGKRFTSLAGLHIHRKSHANGRMAVRGRPKLR